MDENPETSPPPFSAESKPAEAAAPPRPPLGLLRGIISTALITLGTAFMFLVLNSLPRRSMIFYMGVSGLASLLIGLALRFVRR